MAFLNSNSADRCASSIRRRRSLQGRRVLRGTHAALTTATPHTRERIAKALLDYLRRELAIDVELSHHGILLMVAAQVRSDSRTCGPSTSRNAQKWLRLYSHVDDAPAISSVDTYVSEERIRDFSRLDQALFQKLIAHRENPELTR